MLNEGQTKNLDKAWRHLWSSGITNPIVVSEILSSALMALAEDPGCERKYRSIDAHGGSAVALASELGSLRRRFGLPAGSEIEAPDFWQDTTLFGNTLGTIAELGERGADLLGDAYEHILSKLSTAGHFGQFRTPRHIVNLMVRIMNPGPSDVILDPACGSGGFLVSAAEHVGNDVNGHLHGWEIDRTIARLAMSNIIFHSMPATTVQIQDGLVQRPPIADVILANPPFSGDVSPTSAAHFRSGSSRSEVLFVEAIAGLLNEGGRAAIVVPTGVLDGRAASAVKMRKALVTEHNVRCIIELPSHVFRPYADVRTAIIIIDNSAAPSSVAMLRIEHDGYSQDSRRRIQKEKSELPEVEEFIATGECSLPHGFVDMASLEASDFILTPGRWVERSKGDVQQHQSLAQSVDTLGRDVSELQSLVLRLQEIVNK